MIKRITTINRLQEWKIKWRFLICNTRKNELFGVAVLPLKWLGIGGQTTLQLQYCQSQSVFLHLKPPISCWFPESALIQFSCQFVCTFNWEFTDTMNATVNPSTTKLFRVRKTVFKMLSKRGYAVDESDLNMTLDTFLREVGVWWELWV